MPTKANSRRRHRLTTDLANHDLPSMIGRLVPPKSDRPELSIIGSIDGFGVVLPNPVEASLIAVEVNAAFKVLVTGPLEEVGLAPAIPGPNRA